jgi:hypothetical protein
MLQLRPHTQWKRARPTSAGRCWWTRALELPPGWGELPAALWSSESMAAAIATARRAHRRANSRTEDNGASAIASVQEAPGSGGLAGLAGVSPPKAQSRKGEARTR